MRLARLAGRRTINLLVMRPLQFQALQTTYAFRGGIWMPKRGLDTMQYGAREGAVLRRVSR